MKKFFCYATLLALLGCEALGIGKKCYTCTTSVYVTSNTTGASSAENKTDVCGESDRKKLEANQGSTKQTVGSAYITTTTRVNCVSK